MHTCIEIQSCVENTAT